MAANNNSLGGGYSNPQSSQYQNTGYPTHPMVVIPRQRPAYNQQQQQPQYQMLNQPMPHMQGYPPSRLMQGQPTYSEYQNSPLPQQQVQYQMPQQYQQPYVRQQQYQQPMNRSGHQSSQALEMSSLPAYQFDGPASTVPRPRKKSTPRASESGVVSHSPAHPASYQSNNPSIQSTRPRQQYQPPMTAGHGLTRPASATPGISSSDARQPISTPRPPSTIPKPVAPALVPVVPTSTMTESSRQSDLPVDYQVLLLALADEYISKAHSMASMLVRDMREVDLDQYHKLIASGLGCMESVLRNFKFPSPTMEARLVHRYCTLLFDETENDDVAHEMLTRTVKMCERHKLIDLRYSLIHLQLRFHFRSRPVAALKMLDQMLLIIEAYKHTSWDYAMRFLRVSLSLQMLQPDISGSLQQLRRVSRLAEINNHVPILATSAALEALVHLRNGGPEAVQLSQRALAAARKHQLDPSLRKMPQLAALLDCLDLCCDLISLTPDQAMVKMKQMQKVMDDASLKKTWRSDGSFCVPFGDVEAASLATEIAANTGGVFEQVSTGQRALVFRWIRRSELFSLGYLFSGIATAHKNSVDRKAERYLEEGSKIFAEKYDPSDEQGLQSLNSAQAQIERRSYFHQSMLLHLALIRCNRSDWLSAKKVLEPLARSLPKGTRQTSSDPMDMLTIYLTGLIHQGTGDVSNALANYQCPALSLKPGQKIAGALQELRLLAALNTILILQSDHSQTTQVHSLLASLEQPCLTHPDKSFAAAYNLVAVSSTPGLPIIKTKSLLSTAMAAAKRVANLHLICVTMNLMTATFFKDIVGEQAQNSARVGQTLALKCANPLWCAVASGMLARTSELCGLKEGMVAAREEGLKAMGKLPDGLIGRFQQPGR